MLSNNRKISIRQAMLVFLTMTFTPSIRVIPTYASLRGQQASWIVPIIGIIPLFLLTLIFNSLYEKHKESSLLEIYKEVMGKAGVIVIAVIYLIWAILLAALYVRYFSERMTGIIMTNVNINIFSITILLLLAYGLRYGFAILARINEIVISIIVIVFTILVILMIPNIRWEFLTPISSRDILPVLNGSIGVMGFSAFFTFIFLFSDIINNKEKVNKMGIKTLIFLQIVMTILMAATIGTFSHTIVCRTHFPFILAVKQISLFGVIEKLESIVIIIWITADFVLIGFFILISLRIIKFLFKPLDEKSYLYIFLLFIYLLSLYISNSTFELSDLSSYIIVPGNIILGFFLPLIIFFIGKMRKVV